MKQIKDEKQSKRETVCLFIDFEKAYDSVWKKGLAVKLWGKGVTGKFMNLLDSFMNNREIQLQVNEMKGPNRECGEYGLPQGSVISPILFKFFLHDFEESFDDRNNIAIYKFADDGTVKTSGNKLGESMSEMKIVMNAIDVWTKRWRMVINCQKDKTELIHFSPAAKQQQQLYPIPLGSNSIQFTSATKVLGVCIDNKLYFEDHSCKMAKKMCNRWRMITRLTNRTNGLNHQVIVKLVTTTFLSILLYGGIVWMTTKNIRSINGIWYEMLKRSIGAIYSVNQSIAEVITGLPPLSIWSKMNSIKHYLKTFQQSGVSKNDVYMDYITKKLSGCPGSTIAKDLKDVVRFLEWKRTERPECFTEIEHSLMEEQKRNLSRLVYLSSNCYSYDRSLIAKYSEILWQESINNTLSLEGKANIPKVSCEHLPIPPDFSRLDEVLYMSLFYENNTMYHFLWQRSLVESPLCRCMEDIQTVEHILCDCPMVEEDVKRQLDEFNWKNLGYGRADITVDLLNCSRNPELATICKKIIRNPKLKLWQQK